MKTNPIISPATVIKATLLWALSLFTCACNHFLEEDMPTTRLLQELVFSDEVAAASAVKGIYADMLDANAFASGNTSSVAFLASLSADEITYVVNDPAFQVFESNAIDPQNKHILNIWTSAYKTIYEANAVMEGLNASTAISPMLKNQFLGEALFIRAFTYFHLMNAFGDVPLVTSTDYKQNDNLPRTATARVYDQIIDDLKHAENLTADTYTDIGRQRANRAAVQSLLARVYLYQQDWANAIVESTQVISNPQYTLVEHPNDVFLAGSAEAIWQLAYPVSTYTTTYEGKNFVIDTTEPFQTILTDRLLTSFEPNDKRRQYWIGTYTTTEPVYFPYKYKVKGGSLLPLEHSTPLRLAEQYLIRAEARTQQNEIPRAIADVDLIRQRAGLPLIADINPTITKTELLAAIQKERQLELFTEGAHRWFDLKRTNGAIGTLQSIKPALSTDALLYPLPESEFSKNPSLKHQNPGY